MSRIRLYRTEAIVLKRIDFGEADRILTLYTPERGKVRAIAKGGRRIASRKSGHVELFTHAALLLAEGRQLDIVTQAETVRPYRRIREDLIRTTYAYHIAELVDRFIEEGLESPRSPRRNFGERRSAGPTRAHGTGRPGYRSVPDRTRGN